MKKIVSFVTRFEVEIPDNQVQSILTDYRKVIKERASVQDLFYDVAWNYDKGMRFVEGVGDLEEEGITCSIIDHESEVDDEED